ncbi:vacuolar protein sorting-associated protein 4A-like [Dermacentor albipictus]|uniref:vacuolar protein sorting-associated protein 4A-like n=1 Tax=Dermacentor albipictus TaxID=60249 RepID=UPI0038FD301E
MASQHTLATMDVKTALELSKQAADEEAKKQFANAYKIYRKTVEAYLSATLAVRTMCAPYIERVLRLKDHARDIDQEILCAGMPEMKCIHQLPLLGLLLPPWCLTAVTVSAKRKICYTNDIIGIDPMKNKFSQILMNPKSKGVSLILLHGPHGSGKSFMVRAITSKYPDKSVFIVDIGTFMAATSQHEGVKLASVMIKNFRKHDCGVLVLEDLDRLYSQRTEGIGREIDAMRKEILAYMQELKEKRKFREVVVATARKPWRLEKSMMETFQSKISLPPPQFNERVAIITRELGKVRCPSFTESDIQELASRTERYSCYQVMSILRLALARNFEKLESITLKEDAERVDHLTKDDILVVSDILGPDITEEDMVKHHEFTSIATTVPVPPSLAVSASILPPGVGSAGALPANPAAAAAEDIHLSSAMDRRVSAAMSSSANAATDIRTQSSAQSEVPGPTDAAPELLRSQGKIYPHEPTGRRRKR